MVGSIQGERLANRYRVLRHLADGSSGSVYLAEDVGSGQRVAIKVLVPELSFDARTLPHLRARMQRWLKVPRRRLRAVDHVVDVVDLGVLTNDDLYVVMPYLEGDHLRALVQRRGALSWAQARVPLIQIGRLIADVHRELADLGLTAVLGTLQASNCYCLRGQAREDSIRIIQSAVDDLIVRRLWREPGDHVRSLARYAAPELGTGERVDVRADVYSLGVIAFELLTGHLPFDDPNAARLAAMHLMSPVPRPSVVAGDQTIPDEVEAMILRALSKRPEDRFATMDAFVEAMTELPGRLVQAARRARATLPGIEAGAAAAGDEPGGAGQGASARPEGAWDGVSSDMSEETSSPPPEAAAAAAEPAPGAAAAAAGEAAAAPGEAAAGEAAAAPGEAAPGGAAPAAGAPGAAPPVTAPQAAPEAAPAPPQAAATPWHAPPAAAPAQAAPVAPTPASGGAGPWIALVLAVGVVLAWAGLGGGDLGRLLGGAREGEGAVAAASAGPEAREARELLHQAHLAEQRGDPALAYRLASGSYEQLRTIEALEVMGRSACLVGDVDSARWIFRHLPAASQPGIRAVCEGASLRLDP